MVRQLGFALPLAVLLLLPFASIACGDAEEGVDDIPVIATDEEAAEALAVFKEQYRARGLSGEEKLLQRDYALSELALVQHPDVVKELTKVSKSGNETLRALAVIYLGEQNALPGVAGPTILKSMKRGKKDPMLLICALQSVSRLRYYGATKEIGSLLQHRNFAVKKAAIQAIGAVGEMRLWKEIFKLAGVTVKSGDDAESGDKSGGGKEEVVDEGYSYEGAEATVDWGLSDNTAENAEAKRQVDAKIAANKAAAMAKSGRSGGGAGGGGGATARGGVARDPKELMPFVLNTIFLLTGERFSNSKEVAKWIRANRETIRERVALLDQLEKCQKEEARELR